MLYEIWVQKWPPSGRNFAVFTHFRQQNRHFLSLFLRKKPKTVFDHAIFEVFLKILTEK